MPRATTVRFTDEMFARLDQASARTGMPVNSIVIAACLEWMDRHTPPGARATGHVKSAGVPVLTPAPRWATIRRAVQLGSGRRRFSAVYPFERFSAGAQNMLKNAQSEATSAGLNYIGTEHLLLAAFADPGAQASQILAAIGISESAVRATLSRMTSGKKPPAAEQIVPTARVKTVIELAFKLCGAAGDPRVSTGHILLAMATEKEGIGAKVMAELGATPERVEDALEAIQEPEA